MDTNIILLLLSVPLLGSLVNIFFGKKLGNYSGILATLAILLSFIVTIVAFFRLRDTGEAIQVNLFQWMRFENFEVSFGFLLDQLSILWLLFVTGIGTLIHLYSTSYMKGDENFAKYFAYLNLFIFFMVVLVMGSNLLVMFIGWEGVGLCSYLLIGFWYKNQSFNDAAKKAFIMNRVGDLGFLVGIFILAYLFKTLDYVSIREALATITDPQVNTWLGWATLALFIGAVGKSAQIPLYTWLPDAMAGPTPVSALIHAATMVTAGIFLITRLNFAFDLTPQIQNIIAIVGAVTALYAATIGLVQNDIKKVLAYSTVSQLGLMFMAIGFGAYEIAVFHVITHAFFKACLFLGSGSVIHAMGGEQDMRKMGGLRKYMIITYATFLMASLAISGIPPFSGFFSKDEILMVAFEKNTLLWALAALASIMTAFYMFRLLFLTFFNKFRGTEKQKHHLHESPTPMTIPLIVLAILSLVGGLISLPGCSWLNNYLRPVIANSAAKHTHAFGTVEYTLMALAIVGALIGIGIAYYKYIQKREIPPSDVEIQGIHKLLYDRYYIDELYTKIFVKPLYSLAVFFRDYTEVLLSGIVLGFGKIALLLSAEGKKAQTGNIGLYLFAFVFGICVLLYYLFIAR